SGRAPHTVNERARMSHGDPLGGGTAGQHSEDRLGEALADERLGQFLLFGPANLADDKQRLGVSMGLEGRHETGKPRTLPRIAANTDPQRLPDAALAETVADLIRERTAFRHDADWPDRQRGVREEADLHVSRHSNSGRRGTDTDCATIAHQAHKL